jgi:hypothetical protein
VANGGGAVKARDLRIVWKWALSESDLDRTAKLVGHVIAQHMDPDGACFPGRQRLARLCSLSDRTVDAAARRLEAAGFLAVQRTKGGNSRSNTYQALMPETANEVRRSEWARAKLTTVNGEPGALNSEPGALNSERRSPEGVVRGPKRTTPIDERLGVNWSPMALEDREHLDHFELSDEVRHQYADLSRQMLDTLGRHDSERGKERKAEEGSEGSRP